MHIVVLGSAAGGGHPQWNCHTPASQRAWQELPGAARRTQASIAVSDDGKDWLLINASPDLRQQILATPALWPREGLRHSPIKAVLLSSGEIDHITGLLSLRERQPFSLYASQGVLDVLAENSIFDALNPEFVTRQAFSLEQPLSLLGLEVIPYAVPGKVPLFMESRAGSDLAGPEDTTLGLEVRAGGQSFHYLPGCAAMTDALRERLKGASLVFFDGTLWRDDELIAAGVSPKSGQRMGHMSIDGEAGSMAAFADLDVARKVFIHINTTNPVLNALSPEHAAAAARGWEVAYDGMEISL
ncbi:pyrroloquinoline quinone biosynthesis protein PqqB [Frateuria aurantia]|uniref:Coenzyme PQQ synthesis protein B n=1 Tax=Frateuria aurantia (strain ATCC 33424 / DSM 6220 / KCTC 2777 / LMG 1558 / NBRC 3245 / NCIMB 13370) TaxID=767434 RepID=H8L2E3_FRAAD|nr:pyrroloquinoline quinone biosynthesis protein PqqB [Frateuria aurantia]AFC84777.1 coenzyme PQQ biosynthesis protein B [Frateuria aurantia DSM 6220]